MKRQQSGLGRAVVAVVITLVVLWFLCQSTFGGITVPVPGVLPPSVLHHVPHHGKR